MNEDYNRLVSLAKTGDVDAFGELYLLVYEDMYHMAYYMLGNVHDAEDIVSETVLAAFAHIYKLREAAAFRGWIFKILVNQCRKKRKQYINKTYSLDADVTNENGDSFGEHLTAEQIYQMYSKEEAMDVRQAFLKLPDTERSILSLSVFGGYTSVEIGRILHMNANTVRTRQSRALRKLALALGEDG